MYNPINFTDAPPGDCFSVRIKSVTVSTKLVRNGIHIHHVTENGVCFLAKFVAKNFVSGDRMRFERQGQYA